MDMWVHSAESDAEWTRALIRRIEGGAYSFAGEEGSPYEGVLTGEEPGAASSG
jgi:hypothetical protein